MILGKKRCLEQGLWQRDTQSVLIICPRNLTTTSNCYIMYVMCRKSWNPFLVVVLSFFYFLFYLRLSSVSITQSMCDLRFASHTCSPSARVVWFLSARVVWWCNLCAPQIMSSHMKSCCSTTYFVEHSSYTHPYWLTFLDYLLIATIERAGFQPEVDSERSQTLHYWLVLFISVVFFFFRECLWVINVEAHAAQCRGWQAQ